MRLEFGQYRTAENFIRNKHVVAAGRLTWDAGSIPAASTIKTKKLTRKGGFFRFDGGGGYFCSLHIE